MKEASTIPFWSETQSLKPTLGLLNERQPIITYYLVPGTSLGAAPPLLNKKEEKARLVAALGRKKKRRSLSPPPFLSSFYVRLGTPMFLVFPYLFRSCGHSFRFGHNNFCSKHRFSLNWLRERGRTRLSYDGGRDGCPKARHTQPYPLRGCHWGCKSRYIIRNIE